MDPQVTSLLQKLKFICDSGSDLMNKSKWYSAKGVLSLARGIGHQLSSLRPDENSCIEAASQLITVGKQLTTLLYMKEALHCHETAIALIKGRAHNKAAAEILASAVECIGQWHVYVGYPEKGSLALNSIVQDSALESIIMDADVQKSLGHSMLEIGLAQVQSTMYSSAVESLKSARAHFTSSSASYVGTETEAQLLSALGQCLHSTADDAAEPTLEQAISVWRSLEWPVTESKTIVHTMRYYAEHCIKSTSKWDFRSFVQDLLYLHPRVLQINGSMLVADTLTHIGIVGIHHDEATAPELFEMSRQLYKNNTDLGEKGIKEQIKLLRFIGVSSYNYRDFARAAEAYVECLVLLQLHQPCNHETSVQIAEVSASLGFTYSRLRDFNKTLQFYEQALELESKLSPEDLELLITNVGGLYHVKAVMCAQEGDRELSDYFHRKAQEYFRSALRFSWKSFPFINYGYYMLYQNDFSQAVHYLQQGYLNGVIDKDTVEFDHTEDPILIEDLRFELVGRDDIGMPATVTALYLQVVAQVEMGERTAAMHTASKLEHEVETSKYSSYYTSVYGPERMKALCYSILGYAYRRLGLQHQAIAAFQQALNIVPDYAAAKLNLDSEKAGLKC